MEIEIGGNRFQRTIVKANKRKVSNFLLIYNQTLKTFHQKDPMAFFYLGIFSLTLLSSSPIRIEWRNEHPEG